MKKIFSLAIYFFRVFKKPLFTLLRLKFRAAGLLFRLLNRFPADSFIFGIACFAVGFYLHGDKFKPGRNKDLTRRAQIR